ncbi:MAG: phosphoglucomutase/phosphomannomutase family protein [Aquificaceae bacterium]|nr:MAG: phosphoglucomutase/phosphomannomutase family protein [Aquificaceae bacterium]
MVIKFGTDGWRGVIAKDFTFENVSKVALAHAEVLRRKNLKRVFIGYDNRFLSENFAKEVATIFYSEGFEVNLSPKAVTTPLVSWAVKHRGFDGGVMITASHNPPAYNGYKIKEGFGGAATPEFISEVESFINRVSPKGSPQEGTLNEKDFTEEYINAVRNEVNLDLFREREIKVIHDPMFGSSAGYLRKALENTKVTVCEIHAYRDPLFGGRAPEPVEKNAHSLMEKVRAEGAFCGIMNDGDGDRVALIDEKGNFVNSQLVYALLMLHLLENKNLKGTVVKTVSTTYLADRIAKHFGVELIETPVGFKHINAVILQREDVIFGGEESGGYGFPQFTPERDGLLSALNLLELFLLKDKTPSQMVEELFQRFGRAYYRRVDLTVKPEEKEKLKGLIKAPPSTLAGLKVREVKTIDGLKLVFENDGWLLIRPSGTEPLLRIYCEMPTLELRDKILRYTLEIFK